MDDVGTFDRLAGIYEAAMPPARAGPIVEGLARARRPVRRVLDAGGGSGRGVAALDRWIDVETFVVDAATGMARRARANGHGAVAGDATRLPVATDAVDAALVVDALHHMSDHRAVLGELRRVVRPGGVAVLREFDPATVRGRLLVAAEHLWGFESTFHPPDALAELAGAAGFETSVLDAGFGYTVVGVAGNGRHKSRRA